LSQLPGKKQLTPAREFFSPFFKPRCDKTRNFRPSEGGVLRRSDAKVTPNYTYFVNRC
jgi:hypothetical protein